MNINKIDVSEYGIALVSLETAKRLGETILKKANTADCIVDFQGVVSITTQFAKAMLSPAFCQLGEQRFRSRVKLNFPNADLMVTISDAISDLSKA